MGPLSECQLEGLMDLLAIPDAGKGYIRETRNSPPSRRVASTGRLNTTWRYASRKMRHTEACESTHEMRFALSCDLSRHILEHWDQPPKVAIPTPSRRTRKSTPYTPDFLVIEEESIWIAQVKKEADCREKKAEYPDEWILSADGTWEHLPAQNFFATLGLPHRVVTERAICPIKTENLELIWRTLELEPVQERVYQDVASTLRTTPALSLADLARTVGLLDMSPLIHLLGAGVLFGDLEHRLITRPHTFMVAGDAVSLAQALYLETELPADPTGVAPFCRDGLIAADRIRQLRGQMKTTASARTLARWNETYEQNGDIASLAPRHRFKGNRTSRQQEWHSDLLMKVINERYLTPVSISPVAAYRFYLLEHSIQNPLQPVSARQEPVARSTFYNKIHQLNKQKAEGLRGGKRRENAVRPPVDPALRDVRPGRPFQRAHIDHQLLAIDVLIAVSQNDFIFRSPWLTAMRDEGTDLILAQSLSFKPPSIRSCCMVLRDCARVHSRLPETIVVDNGSDFNSTYFEATLAHLGIHKQNRPPGAPRFGSPIESAFGSIQSFIENLPGNKKNDQRERGASSSHKGQEHATFQFEDVVNGVAEYLRIFNAYGIDDLHSPEQRNSQGLAKYPASGQKVEFNHAFLRLTAPGHRNRIQLDSARGLHYAKRHFRHPDLNVLPDKAKVVIFEEPWDANRIYALVNGKLVTCRNTWAEDLTAEELARSAFNEMPGIECTDVKRGIERTKDIEIAKAMEEATSRAAIAQKLIPTIEQSPRRISRIKLLALESAPTPYEVDEVGP